MMQDFIPGAMLSAAILFIRDVVCKHTACFGNNRGRLRFKPEGGERRAAHKTFWGRLRWCQLSPAEKRSCVLWSTG